MIPLVDGRQQEVDNVTLGIARAEQRASSDLLEGGAALLAFRKQLELAGEDAWQEHSGRRAQTRKDQHHARHGLHEQARLVVVIEAGNDPHRLFRDEGESGRVEDGVEDPLQGGRFREDAGGVVEVEDALDLGEALGEEAEEAGLCGDRETAQVESEEVDGCLNARWRGQLRGGGGCRWGITLGFEAHRANTGDVGGRHGWGGQYGGSNTN